MTEAFLRSAARAAERLMSAQRPEHQWIATVGERELVDAHRDPAAAVVLRCLVAVRDAFTRKGGRA